MKHILYDVGLVWSFYWFISCVDAFLGVIIIIIIMGSFFIVMSYTDSRNEQNICLHNALPGLLASCISIIHLQKSYIFM